MIYVHYKGGEYEFIAEAIHTETEEELVIYRSIKDNKLYARPKDMFFSDVIIDDRKIKRFDLKLS